MKRIVDLIKHESAPGAALFIATIAALVAQNSPLASIYDKLLETPVVLGIGTLEIHKPLLLWINDGLMALFFLLVGLELKHEVLSGHLADRQKLLLPVIGAVGGMAAPALIYALINSSDPIAQHGWAIPSATDIAFALGVMSLLGPRVPAALRIFLLTLAIADDLGAILVIAFFYTTNLSFESLAFAVVAFLLLVLCNRCGVRNFIPYFTIGSILWVAVLKSGVHATLAGVVLALFIPHDKRDSETSSPLTRLEHELRPAIAFFILPLFAFANSGVSLDHLSLASVLHPVPLGIALGLFFGNQIGIMLLCWLAVKARLAQLPQGVTWRMLHAVSTLCGVGFTMSLFIASLAFEGVEQKEFQERLGILIGSFLSGIVGYFALRMAVRESPVKLEQNSY
ncbi:MAG: Na+/H+ antiporter NhaA [Bdellovibrionales bacterium]|nr:Na+/H+ antiporter NhaA [Bdellovibrionales bacterium]